MIKYVVFALHHCFVASILIGCATKSPPVADNYDYYPLAIKTFDIGMKYISERYIRPIRVSDLAIEGLRGLKSIDPSFRVTVTPTRIKIDGLRSSELNYSKPLGENTKEWAETMAAIVRASRAQSLLIEKTSYERIFEVIFDSATSLLDAFSHYSGAKPAGKARIKRSGFGGIGVIVKAEMNGARVIRVLDSSPAATAGVIANDLITHIDGFETKEKIQKALLAIIRGQIGSLVEIMIRRQGGGKLVFSMKRERIIAPSTRVINKEGILYLFVNSFNRETVHEITTQIQKAKEQEENTINGLIIDLRSNPGGILSQAIGVTDLFLKTGRIVSTHGRHPSSRRHYTARSTDILSGQPIVVLINGRSASAAEIVAAALQDNKRAIIVGTTSFGKGSIQFVGRLPNDGELVLTWSKFVAPSGYILHGLGVPPNVCSRKSEVDSKFFASEILDQTTNFLRIKKAWRKVSQNNKKKKENLRNKCPASNKRDPHDLKLARKLISDNILYNVVSGNSLPVAAIRE